MQGARDVIIVTRQDGHVGRGRAGEGEKEQKDSREMADRLHTSVKEVCGIQYFGSARAF